MAFFGLEWSTWTILATLVIFAATVVLHITSLIFYIAPRSRKFLMRNQNISYVTSSVEKKCLITGDFKSRPLFTKPEVSLSIIVPCMNEEARLPSMLRQCIKYCKERVAKEKGAWTYEIIIADDGSTDETCAVAQGIGKEMDGNVAVLRLEQNFGKGGAVRSAVMCARGTYILFADADGATEFEDYAKLEQEMIRLSGTVDATFPGVVVGSRSHLEEESKAHRSIARTILMHGFHLLVYIFAVRGVRDTQCGFKLFTRSAAAELFSILHIERWAFDVELLYLAEKRRFAVGEVAVRWEEIDGSKVTPIWSWLQMGRDVVMIWYRYATGIWKNRFPTD